ncbi:MAG: hypothetical protein U5J83_01110 [Bryobacterales bacterium]|nr:hypothetical protein [Bryobacterales bacterium]
MTTSAIVSPRNRSIPYALPSDALEGLLHLAAHVALTEAAVLFLQQEETYWVLSTCGVSPQDAHTAALLLPDVLEHDANEYLCLDAAAAPEAASLMASALAARSGFLLLRRFVVEGQDCYAILALAHSVARPKLSDETASLLSEIVRQIALRIEARTEKRELEASRERRQLRDRFLVAICRDGALGQCLVDPSGRILSLSEGLSRELGIDRRETLLRRFEQVFAFESAFRDEPAEASSAPAAGDAQRIPWERVLDAQCFYRQPSGELARLIATAAPARLHDGSEGWCIAISRGEAHAVAAFPLPHRFPEACLVRASIFP